MNHAVELNLDGLVGPTHHYAGLATGNLASQTHAMTVSNPRRAALQGLEKMKLLADMGVEQAVLPPHERPDLSLLRRLGFEGSVAQMLASAQRDAPELLAAAFSASSMWAANAATVCPSADAADNRVHFTPANLTSSLHRSIEPAQTAAILERIFRDPTMFVHHPPLPASTQIRDEGAANHLRLCRSPGEPGVQVFAFGTDAFAANTATPQRFSGRQTLQASGAVARLHRLDPDRTFFVQQHPAAIDAGVFHNDVIAVSHRSHLLYHEQAFGGHDGLIDRLAQALDQHCGTALRALKVTSEQLPLAEAVNTYFFNSQLVTLSDGKIAMICPEECRQSERAYTLANSLVSRDGPAHSLHFVDLRESMKNGGGPACLRLRIVLTPPQLAAMHQGVRLTSVLYSSLKEWIQRHYRERLHVADLADPRLVDESHAALDELTRIIELGPLYPFQR